MSSLQPPALQCPPGTPVDALPIQAAAMAAAATPVPQHRGSPEDLLPRSPQPLARQTSKTGLSSSPKLFSARAAIMSHETRSEDKRFTVYKIDVSLDEKSTFSVFHRYSEFRELYEYLKENYPKEVAAVKFPAKRIMGNFDPTVIQARQRSLQEFMQTILGSPTLSENERVRRFLLETPRHGRGHTRHQSDEAVDLEDSKLPGKEDDKEGKEENRFDLGESENKKASVADFTMLKVIGKGSFGKVFLAKHVATDKLYAVKVLNKDLIIRQNEIKHIMSERNVLLGNVHHPFLVGLQYSFQTPTKLYFVLDYANGGELFFHLQREKRFSVPRALFYAAEITSALGYLHSLNIVYRDLKPENILFDVSGHVVLTDFGLCKENILPGQTTSTFCGTPEYLAPEVLQRQPYGRPVDWWCLGCVTYEMMCGLPPFYSRHCDEMYERILHDVLRFPDFIPLAARDLLHGLLVKDPMKRLGSRAEDAQAVKAHPFFANIDWAALDRREIPPPWVPMVGDAMDLRHFDPSFVNEPVPESVSEPGLAAAAEQGHRGSQPMRVVSVSEVNPFVGFTFVGDAALEKH